ncbi:MAG: hypothetical protein HZB76_05965 [Chlamydiae bacterium]|nr:hypothetical protein [Chlamydiota bacterium]
MPSIVNPNSTSPYIGQTAKIIRYQQISDLAIDATNIRWRIDSIRSGIIDQIGLDDQEGVSMKISGNGFTFVIPIHSENNPYPRWPAFDIYVEKSSES